MKIIANFLIALGCTLVLFSCKKESFVAKFDESPQQRIGKQIDSVRNILTTAENGWIATLPTGLGGGYAFFMTFDKNEFVNMYADLTNSTATEKYNSQYRIKQDMGTSLVFDTYTYISWLNNPETDAFGGRLREGFRSDIEFIYDHSTADSIVFIGKRYRQTFTLIKATAAQKARYENKEYLTAINNIKDFFQNNSNAYINANGQKISIEPNLSNNLDAGKRISFTSVYPGDSIASEIAKYAFTIDQLPILDSGLLFNNIRFTSLRWKNGTNLAAYDAAGREYVIENNPTPLLPLYLLWGTKYTGMFGDYKKIYPGTTAKGAEILNYYYNNTGSQYVFQYLTLTFKWNTINKRLTLEGWHRQGGPGGWTTSAVYNYTVDNTGIFTFTKRSDPDGGYVQNPMKKIHEFMLTNRVTFDYYVVDGTVYAKMASVDNPDIVMTFELMK